MGEVEVDVIERRDGAEILADPPRFEQGTDLGLHRFLP